jgi:2-polyprenyl-6-methoxyphenol hydroxylase-like FAD-dependent oxidoreductase
MSGAGPILLALACHLRRLGLSVRLIEKPAGPSVHSKAIGLLFVLAP